MILIHKNRPSPETVSKLKAAMNSEEFKNADDNDTAMLRSCFDSLISKEKLREELDKEQHSLCVYCMKRIESFNPLNVKIEHYIPLSEDKGKIFDYNNLLLACDGGQRVDVNNAKERVLCCDSSKGNSRIKLNPLNEAHMRCIKYRKDGTVYYSNNLDHTEDELYNGDINDVLCLNGKWDADSNRPLLDTSTEIVKGRKDAYKEAEKILAGLAKKNKLTKNNLQKHINMLKGKPRYDEFIGVTLFVLERRLKRL